VLGRLLAHPATDKAHIGAALAAYEHARLAFATEVVTNTHRIGLMYEFAAGPLPPPDGDENWAEQWGREVHDLFKFQWEGTAEDFWEEAERELLRLCGV
jgi:salicylate hydroxylase